MVLPRAARDGLLLNLTGTAPASGAAAICTLHDAAVFDQPEAYSPLFRGWYRWLFRRLGADGRRDQHGLGVFAAPGWPTGSACPASASTSSPTAATTSALSQADPAISTAVGLRGRRFLLAVGSANPTKNFGARDRGDGRPRRRPTLRLVIAGGRTRDGVRRATGKAADPARVVRLGPVGDAELKALYGAALALVFPSSYEGFGLPPLEAMSCGCPVSPRRRRRCPRSAATRRCTSIRTRRPTSPAGLARSCADDGAARRPGRPRHGTARRSSPGRRRPRGCRRSSRRWPCGRTARHEGPAAQQVLPARDGRDRGGGLGAGRRPGARGVDLDVLCAGRGAAHRRRDAPRRATG